MARLCPRLRPWWITRNLTEFRDFSAAERLGGAVGRTVVDEYDLRRRLARDRGSDLARQGPDIFGFVLYRHDYGYPDIAMLRFRSIPS